MRRRGPAPLFVRTRRRKTVWRRLFFWISASLLTLAVVTVVVVGTFDWNRLKPWINQRASSALERSFSINGDLSVQWRRASELGGWRAWIPMPEVRAVDVQIGNPEWAGDATFAKVSLAEIGIRLLPLLGKRVELPYLRLVGAQAALIRRDATHANWSFNASGEPSAWQVNVRELRLAEASIGLDDRVTAADLELVLKPLDQTIPYSELAAPPQESGDTAARQNKVQDYAYSWSIKGRYRGAPVQGKGQIGSVLSLREGRQAFPLQADAKLGDVRVGIVGTLDDPTDLAGLDLQLQLSGNSMAQLYPYTGIALPDTPPFSTNGQLSARIQPDDSIYRYHDFSGKVGASDLAGTLSYSTAGDRPKLEGKLHSSQLQFADLGPLIGADTSSQPSATLPETPAGRLLPAVAFRTDRWNAMDADVQFDGKKIVQDARLPLADLSTRVRLDDGQLTLDPLAFGLAGGKVRGKVELDSRKPPLRGSVDLSARKLQLKQLFPGVKAMDASFGEINGDIALDASGQSVAALLASANGELKLLMNDGAISKQLMETAGLNVANIVITRLFGDKEVRIDCAAGNFGLAKGLMTPRLAVFDTDNAVIDITGTVNFADEKLALDVRPHTKGLRIFSLRSPLYVQGTFANPDVGVRKAALIAKGGAAIALGAFAAPAAALIPLISPSHDEDSRCETLLSQLRGSR